MLSPTGLQPLVVSEDQLDCSCPLNVQQDLIPEAITHTYTHTLSHTHTHTHSHTHAHTTGVRGYSSAQGLLLARMDSPQNQHKIFLILTLQNEGVCVGWDVCV